MSSSRRATGAVAVVALLAAGCGTSSTGRRTVSVNVDGKVDAFTASLTAYFPEQLTVRQGDTVQFTSTWTGEPHTVTMGTLVDRGLAASDADPDASEEPPDLQKVPPFFAGPPLRANPATTEPCFLATGAPPTDTACTDAQQRQPEFDGTQTYYNSGWLSDRAVFKVKLADDIEPGTYRYFCTLFRSEQQGRITVVESDGSGQTPQQVDQAGQRQMRAAVDALAPMAEALKTGTIPPFYPTPQPNTVIAGARGEVLTGFVNEFGPTTFSVPVGGSVTWTVIGPRSVSFNAPGDVANYITKAPDGTVIVNPRSFAPAGGPAPPPAAQNLSLSGAARAPAAPPTVIDGGSFDGTGFRSSGLIGSLPPNTFAYKLTFTRPGSYAYICIIHPGMEGTINVR